MLDTAAPHHPIRDQDILVWMPMESGQCFVAQFGNGSTWPVIFRGETALGVKVKAEAFRDEVLAKHEAAFITKKNNQIAMKKAREAKS